MRNRRDTFLNGNRRGWIQSITEERLCWGSLIENKYNSTMFLYITYWLPFEETINQKSGKKIHWNFVMTAFRWLWSLTPLNLNYGDTWTTQCFILMTNLQSGPQFKFSIKCYGQQLGFSTLHFDRWTPLHLIYLQSELVAADRHSLIIIKSTGRIKTLDYTGRSESESERSTTSRDSINDLSGWSNRCDESLYRIFQNWLRPRPIFLSTALDTRTFTKEPPKYLSKSRNPQFRREKNPLQKSILQRIWKCISR